MLMDGEAVDTARFIRRMEVRRSLERVVVSALFEFVWFDFLFPDVERQIVVCDGDAVLADDLRHVEAILQAGERDRFRAAVRADGFSQQEETADIVKIQIQIAEIRVERERHGICRRPLACQHKRVVVHILRRLDRRADCLRSGDRPQRNRGERRVAQLVFIVQHDGCGQVVRQLVFVDIAIVSLDLDIIIPGGKSLQRDALVVRHALRVVQLVSGGIIQIQVQVAGPLLEVDPDIT